MDALERLGAAIRAARLRRGWSQAKLARQLADATPGVDSLEQATVSKWERGEHLPSLEVRPALRRLLGPEVARLLDAAELRAFERSPTLDAEKDRSKGDDTNRRDATAGLLASAAVTAVSPGQAVGRLLDGDEWRDPLSDTAAPGRIGSAHLESVVAATVDLERLDAEQGGGRAYGSATGLIRRINGWLRDGSYPSQVGEGLRHALGDLQEWAGWFAYDAGDQRAARDHYLEGLLVARALDDKSLEVFALDSMSLQAATSLGQGRDAVDLARAAQRSAAGWATPRLTALLHLRAARGHSATPDLGGFRRELASAYHFFDKGPHEDDPLWIRFLTEMELAGLEATCYEDLGIFGRATGLYREVIDRADSDRQRNKAYYTVRLGQLLLRQGDVTGAGEIGIEALPLVSAIKSGRIGQRLAALRSGLAPHRSSPQAGEFIDRYNHAFAGPPD